jgi:hypothetical protein
MINELRVRWPPVHEHHRVLSVVVDIYPIYPINPINPIKSLEYE